MSGEDGDDDERPGGKTIPSGRTVLFYLGTILMASGIVLFLLTFFGVVSEVNQGFGPGPGFGPPHGFGQGPNMPIGAVGVVRIIAGSWIRTIGAQGLAGAGVVLDPQQSRQDLEPYSRMAGGMLKDALEEAEVSGVASPPPEPVIMVRCQHCGKLNAEDAKFCQECGRRFVSGG